MSKNEVRESFINGYIMVEVILNNFSRFIPIEKATDIYTSGLFYGIILLLKIE